MDQVQRSQGVKEMWMQLTQIKFGGNLEQMHKQLKQERIVLEKSAKLNLDHDVKKVI